MKKSISDVFKVVKTCIARMVGEPCLIHLGVEGLFVGAEGGLIMVLIVVVAESRKHGQVAKVLFKQIG